MVSGIGGTIIGIEDGGSIWGKVVEKEAKCWRLESNRVAKFFTQGTKWEWGCGDAERPLPNIRSGSVAQKQPTMASNCDECQGFAIVSSVEGYCTIYSSKSSSNPSPQPRLIVLVGIQGSGKSTFASEINSNYEYVNQDTLKNRPACEKAASEAFKRGKPAVVDRCNFDVKQRETWLRLAIAYWPAETCVCWVVEFLVSKEE